MTSSASVSAASPAPSFGGGSQRSTFHQAKVKMEGFDPESTSNANPNRRSASNGGTGANTPSSIFQSPLFASFLSESNASAGGGNNTNSNNNNNNNNNSGNGMANSMSQDLSGSASSDRSQPASQGTPSGGFSQTATAFGLGNINLQQHLRAQTEHNHNPIRQGLRPPHMFKNDFSGDDIFQIAYSDHAAAVARQNAQQESKKTFTALDVGAATASGCLYGYQQALAGLAAATAQRNVGTGASAGASGGAIPGSGGSASASASSANGHHGTNGNSFGSRTTSSWMQAHPNSLSMMDPRDLFGADAAPYVPVDSGANGNLSEELAALATLLVGSTAAQQTNSNQFNGDHNQRYNGHTHNLQPDGSQRRDRGFGSMASSAPAQTNPFSGLDPAQAAQLYAALSAVQQPMPSRYNDGMGGSPFSFSPSTQDSTSAFSTLFESIAGLGINGNSLGNQPSNNDAASNAFENYLVDDHDTDNVLGTPATGSSVLSHKESPGEAPKSQPQPSSSQDRQSASAPSVPKQASGTATNTAAGTPAASSPAPTALKHSRPSSLVRAETGTNVPTKDKSTRGRRPSTALDDILAAAGRGRGVGAHRNASSRSRSRLRQTAYARPSPAPSVEATKPGPNGLISPTKGIERFAAQPPAVNNNNNSNTSDDSAESSGGPSAAMSPAVVDPAAVVIKRSESATRRGSANDDDSKEVLIDTQDPGNTEVDVKPVEEKEIRQLTAEELAIARKSRRRLSHNEVERKRRETINEKIQELEQLLPPQVVANALAARETEPIREEDEDMLEAFNDGEIDPVTGKKKGRARSRKTIKKAAVPDRLCKGTVLCLTVDLVKHLQEIVQVKTAREQALHERIQQLQQQLGLPPSEQDDLNLPDVGQGEELRAIDEMAMSGLELQGLDDDEEDFDEEEEDRGRSRDTRGLWHGEAAMLED